MSLKKETRKWTSQINHGGKKQHLGYFNDEQWGSVIISIVVPLRWPARRRGNSNVPLGSAIKTATDRSKIRAVSQGQWLPDAHDPATRMASPYRLPTRHPWASTQLSAAAPRSAEARDVT
eukprot:COSAG06_NODE_4581_length_4128_cov_3.717300_5_plen_120_part_00